VIAILWLWDTSLKRNLRFATFIIDFLIFPSKLHICKLFWFFYLLIFANCTPIYKIIKEIYLKSYFRRAPTWNHTVHSAWLGIERGTSESKSRAVPVHHCVVVNLFGDHLFKISSLRFEEMWLKHVTRVIFCMILFICILVCVHSNSRITHFTFFLQQWERWVNLFFFLHLFFFLTDKIYGSLFFILSDLAKFSLRDVPFVPKD